MTGSQTFMGGLILFGIMTAAMYTALALTEKRWTREGIIAPATPVSPVPILGS